MGIRVYADLIYGVKLDAEMCYEIWENEDSKYYCEDGAGEAIWNEDGVKAAYSGGTEYTNAYVVHVKNHGLRGDWYEPTEVPNIYPPQSFKPLENFCKKFGIEPVFKWYLVCHLAQKN